MALLDESGVNTGMPRHYNRVKSNEHTADGTGLMSQLIIDVASRAMGIAKESDLSIASAEVMTL